MDGPLEEQLLERLEEELLTRSDLIRWTAGAAAGVGLLGAVPTALGARRPASVGRASATIAQIAFSSSSDSEGLDPSISDQNSDIFYLTHLYEPLLGIDMRFQPYPVLAESWEADRRVRKWVFRLRPGVRFHDGSRLTAKDVVFTLRRLVDPKSKSQLLSRLGGSFDPSGVRAVNSRTVEITLKRPDSALPIALAARQALIVKRGTTTFDRNTAIGTGPFKLKSLTHGRSWELSKHRSYWRPGFPKLDGLRGVVIREQATKLQSVLTGASHMGDPIDFSAASTVGGRAQVLVQPNAAFFNIVMDAAKKPFDDERVTLAIKLATDRAAMLKAAFQGYASVASDAPTPANDPNFPPSIGVRKQNIARAKQLLSDAGYKDGVDLELFTTDTVGGQVAFAVAFAEVVRPAGIRIKINQWPSQTYWDEIFLHAPFYVSYYFRRYVPDALQFAFTSNAPFNDSHFKNATLDRLINQALATPDVAQQRALYRRALAIVSNQAGNMIPGMHHRLWVKSKALGGVKLDAARGALLGGAALRS
jgi:peptide/nickel transport system substrate-binding protein